MNSDRELAQGAQAGSLVAFEELVARYEGRVYRFLLQCCRDPGTAAELAQDTFVRAYQALGRFDAARDFGPWLFTIARRKFVDRQRAARRSRYEPVPEIVDETDPAEVVALEEERQGLWRLARRTLSDQQYQAIWLKYAEEMSIAQIASVLGLTEVFVKVQLFRARNALAKKLMTSVDSAPRTASTQRTSAAKAVGLGGRAPQKPDLLKLKMGGGV